MWLCGPLSKTLALFINKSAIYSLSYYDVTKNSIHYLWQLNSGWNSHPKHNLWRACVDGLIDYDVKNSFLYLVQDYGAKPIPYLLPKWPKLTPYLWLKHTLWGRPNPPRRGGIMPPRLLSYFYDSTKPALEKFSGLKLSKKFMINKAWCPLN